MATRHEERRALARAIDGLLDALFIPVAKASEGAASPIEANLAELMTGAWARQWARALDALAVMFAGGTGPITEEELAAALALLARMMGPDLAGLTAEQAGELVGMGYLAGRRGTARKLKVKPNLGLVDKRAQTILGQHTVYWIGNHYDDALAAEITGTARALAFDQGLGREDAGKAMKAALGERFQRSDTYWRGLAAVTMTRSRSMGAMQSLVEAGWDEYEVVAVMDERTSDICRVMNGRIIQVARAVELRDALLGAKSPEDVKALAPWLPAREVRDKATAALPGGLALPPYHFHCRTTVVARVTVPGEQQATATAEAPVTPAQQKAADLLGVFTPEELANRINGLSGVGWDRKPAEAHLGGQANTAAIYQLTREARALIRQADQVHAAVVNGELRWTFRKGGRQVVMSEDDWTVLSMGDAPIITPAGWLPVTYARG